MTGPLTEILFELQLVGSLAKVTAIDPESGIEAVVSGPASAGETALKQLAIRKLQYLLNKSREG